MKHLTILIILLHLSFIPWSQPDISWEQYYNGQANMDDNLSDMIVDYSGNVYITGTSNNGINTDIVTQKYSPAGDILWTHVYNGGSNSDEVAKVIREDNVGNIYVGGESYVDEEGFNMLILKYDSNGNLLWFTMANNPGNSDDKLNDLTFDGSNNVYCVGNFGNNGGIVVYPPNGGLPLWNYTTDVGTYYYTEYLKIILTNTGEAKVLSHYGNEFLNQVHIVTFSSLGLYQGYYYYSAPLGSQAFATDMVLDASGIAYISCYEESFDQDITKIISTASFPSEVVATYAPVAGGNAHPSDIKRDNFGNIYITGFEDLNSSVLIDNNILTIKFNSDGVQQWVEHYGQIGDDRGIDLAIIGGEAYVLGYNTQLNGTQDIVVLRYSSVGNLAAEYPLIYENQDNSTDLSEETPVSLHVSSPSSLLVAGITNSSNVNQNNDFLVVKYCAVTGGFDVGDDLSICQGSEQQLAAVGNGSFLWSPATWLSTPSVSNPLVSIPFNASPNDYIYTCTFMDEFGCSTLTEVTITVLDTPSSPSILINGSNAFCEGGSVMLFATGASGLLWSPTFEEEPIITVTASGIYSATISENGCTSNPSNSIEVEVYPNPAVTISPSGNISFCDDGILTANTIGGQPEYTYNWMNSNSSTSTTVVNETGTYSVEVTDEHGCSGLSLTVVVQVYPTPASPVAPQYSEDSVCAPDVVTLFLEGEGVL